MPRPPTEAFNWYLYRQNETIYFNFANNTQGNQIQTATKIGKPRNGNGAEISSGHQYVVSTKNIVKKIEENKNLENSWILTFNDGKKDIQCLIRWGRHFQNYKYPANHSLEGVIEIIAKAQKNGIIS